MVDMHGVPSGGNTIDKNAIGEQGSQLGPDNQAPSLTNPPPQGGESKAITSSEMVTTNPPSKLESQGAESEIAKLTDQELREMVQHRLKALRQKQGELVNLEDSLIEAQRVLREHIAEEKKLKKAGIRQREELQIHVASVFRLREVGGAGVSFLDTYLRNRPDTYMKAVIKKLEQALVGIRSIQNAVDADLARACKAMELITILPETPMPNLPTIVDGVIYPMLREWAADE